MMFRYFRKPASMGQLAACPTGNQKVVGSTPGQPSRQQSFMVIDHEICSKVIFSLPLIKERQLSVSGEKLCKILLTA